MNESSDTQLARLDERVKSLDKNFNDSIKVVLGEIKDLKDGLAGRIDKLEVSKFPSIDFVQWRTNEFIPLQTKVDENSKFIENFKGKYAMLGIVGMIFVAAVTAMVSSYVTGVFKPKDNTTTTNVICLEEKVIINCPSK